MLISFIAVVLLYYKQDKIFVAELRECLQCIYYMYILYFFNTILCMYI